MIGGLPTLPTPAELGTAEAAYTTNALNSYAGMPVIKSWLSGTLSPETAANVARVAAESAGGSGMAGAPLAMTDLMRILGTTTEAQQQKGLTGLNQAYGVFPQYSPMGLPSLASQNWQAGLGAATKGQELTAEMALAQQKLAAQMQAQQMAQEMEWQKLNQANARNAAYTSALNNFFQALKGPGAATAPAQTSAGTLPEAEMYPGSGWTWGDYSALYPTDVYGPLPSGDSGWSAEDIAALYPPDVYGY